MQTHAELTAPCTADVLFGYVADLGRYPTWMELVHRATPEPGRDDVWSVELRTRVGPLARSKRLRMVRTELIPDGSVVFERQETDGRRHSPWVLRVGIDPVEPAHSRLVMHLSYGGSLWTGGVLQRILDDEIRAGSERLLSLVSGGTTR